MLYAFLSGDCTIGKDCVTSCSDKEDGYYQYCNDCEVIIIEIVVNTSTYIHI